jgi:hypothetical protein
MQRPPSRQPPVVLRSPSSGLVSLSWTFLLRFVSALRLEHATSAEACLRWARTGRDSGAAVVWNLLSAHLVQPGDGAALSGAPVGLQIGVDVGTQSL